jgi:prepilin-type N-terminal cleavage/methylation domain-containing protein
MPKHITGFSLIELMIVISIISILTMMAVPSYQRYTQRARFAEVISTAHVYQTAVALAIQEGSTLEDIHDGNAGIPTPPKPTKNLASLKIEQGVITAIATPAAASATYILKPSHDGSSWAVGGSCLKLGFCNS